MNTATTIKPSGVMDRTSAVASENSTNDTLWSDTTATWSDSTVMWSIASATFNNNALPPNMMIENIKGKLGIKTIKP